MMQLLAATDVGSEEVAPLWVHSGVVPIGELVDVKRMLAAVVMLEEEAMVVGEVGDAPDEGAKVEVFISMKTEFIAVPSCADERGGGEDTV